jgi:formylglycine-generating enzyme required for sulfatase activity
VRRFAVLIGLIVLSLGIGPAHAASEGKRVALVIGNSAYRHAEELPNPRNDATAIAEALRQANFKVDLKIDLDQLGMQHALRDFGLKAEEADVAVVYYAGHGIQVGGENYLLPIDATLERERDLLYEALPLNLVMGEVAQAQRLGLVIIDACRNNPLAEQLRRVLGPIRSRLVGDGMARMDNLPSNTMVAFATRPGEVAVDGTGPHSPYTDALLKHIEEPGLELNLLFRKVRDTVLEETAYRQEPRTYDALGAEPFYFFPPKPNQRPQLPRLAPLQVLDDAGPTPIGIGQPVDPDGDPMTIEVSGLPIKGTVKVADRELSIGDVLSVQQLTSATYSPLAGAVGEAGSFAFLVRDDHGATTIGRVPITVERANQAPVIETTGLLTLPAIPLNIKPPVDPDGDPLTITVAEVPERGTIKDGDRSVKVGDQLTPEALAHLVLQPGAEGAFGDFAYRATDPQGASVTATLQINLPAMAEVETAGAKPGQPPQTSQATPPAAEPAAQPPVPPASAVAAAPAPAQTAPAPAQTAPAPAQAAPATTETAPAATEQAALEPPTTERNMPPPKGAQPAPPSPEVTAIAGEYETVRTSNIRRGPSAETERVTTVAAGATLHVIGMADGRDWYQVETEDGQRGFIYGQLIRPKPQPAPSPEPAPVQEAALPAARISAGLIKDCKYCPEMVKIPAGSFVMGSDSGDWTEKPALRVTIAKPFALGKYELTAGEWQACVDAGACQPLTHMQDATANSPVYNVSWNEVQGYLKWLRQVTGQPYRLPSEAEWEYAARAGTKTRYWWGDSIGTGNADCDGCGGQWTNKAPTKVGSYAPNPFGLYDMSGGVMEWVADCWNPDHHGAPTDGSARTDGDCSQRVLRGGSWRHDPSYSTVTSRLSYDASVRYYTNGVRIARDLE